MAAAVVMTVANARCETSRSSATPNPIAAPTRTPAVRHASTLPIGIAPVLQPGCGCAKTGDWMTAPRIAEDPIGQVSHREPHRRRPMPG